MKIFDKLFNRTPDDFWLETDEQEDVGQPIQSFTKEGKETRIPRNYWRTKVLPDEFRKHWNNADILYNLIVDALQTGFYRETLRATEHLLEIDKDMVRCYTVRGISLLKNRMLDESAAILEEYLAKYGDDGVILCNYAKVFSEKRDPKKSEEILYKSLTVDPNRDNALTWWGAIHRERNGETGYYDSMKQIALIRGSWRPQLWLARQSLEKKNLTDAMVYYSEVLRNPDLPGDALMQISGDLGNNGYFSESLKLISDIYNPKTHGYLPGYNLITSCIQLKQKKDGFKWLSKLRSLNRFDIIKQLDSFENQLNGLPD